MATIRRPTRDYVRVIEDSRRWSGFEHRPDDIFISTPPKSGTTWMQGIVAALFWPDGNRPGDRRNLSPWIDARLRPIDVVLATVDALPHRRFIKTHSPADCVPIFEECRYVTVYRDARDTVMSWANHRAELRPEIIVDLNTLAEADRLDPIAPTLDGFNGDMDALIDEWQTDQSPIVHLASWWPLRHEPFVCFVHYNDLQADLGSEMRRVAEFLDIDVPEQLWDRAIDQCSLGAMRADALAEGGMERGFRGGADSFFYQGTNGRWRDGLSGEQLDRVDQLVTDGLPPEAAEWMRDGSLALGRRPDAIG